jgi:hypothetical protein
MAIVVILSVVRAVSVVGAVASRGHGRDHIDLDEHSLKRKGGDRYQRHGWFVVAPNPFDFFGHDAKPFFVMVDDQSED